MRTSLLLAAVILLAIATVSLAETLMPGQQVVQTIELPANTVKRPRLTDEERDAEKARRDALTPEQRNAEDKERRIQSFEAMRNPAALSETETQTLSYWLFLPSGYEAKTEKKYPLMLFLHGAGERGDDIEKVKIHGPPKLLADPDKVKDWQFITASPQCPDDYGWSPLQLALLLDDLEKKYEIDKDRIYVTGLSMGGYGTWGLLYQFPDRFAAAVPICGGFDPAGADRFTNIPLWVFHGARDRAVPFAMSTDVVEGIKYHGGKNVRFTGYPDLEHDSWTITYENPDVYRWLLEHNRNKRPAVDDKSFPQECKLEAVYQEVGGRPILTIMFTHADKLPFTVLYPFEAFYVRIEVLDAEGKILSKEKEAVSLQKEHVNLVKLQPRQGILRKIDLLDGFTQAGMGHGTMAETMHHVPAMFANRYNISPDDVPKIHKIRVSLRSKSDLSSGIFGFSQGVQMLYGIDSEKENLFVGQHLVVDIPVGGRVNQAVPLYGRLMELGEPLPPKVEPGGLRVTPPPFVPPPLPTER
jgi:poly(3-hydroxybutyrate) depolymerase